MVLVLPPPNRPPVAAGFSPKRPPLVLLLLAVLALPNNPPAEDGCGNVLRAPVPPKRLPTVPVVPCAAGLVPNSPPVAPVLLAEFPNNPPRAPVPAEETGAPACVAELPKRPPLGAAVVAVCPNGVEGAEFEAGAAGFAPKRPPMDDPVALLLDAPEFVLPKRPPPVFVLDDVEAPKRPPLGLDAGPPKSPPAWFPEAVLVFAFPPNRNGVDDVLEAAPNIQNREDGVVDWCEVCRMCGDEDFVSSRATQARS